MKSIIKFAAIITLFSLATLPNIFSQSTSAETGNIIGKVKLSDFTAGETIQQPDFLVSTKGGIQNAVLTLEGLEGAFREEAIVIDQKDMTYVPRIAVTMMGNEVTFTNSDAVLHNVRAVEGEATLINTVMFNSENPATSDLETPGVIDVKCDVHPGMQAYIVVTDNPFFAKSNEAGLFTIEAIPVGTYKMKAWHEKFGSLEKEVTITAGEKTAVIFEVTRESIDFP